MADTLRITNIFVQVQEFLALTNIKCKNVNNREQISKIIF